MHVDWSRTIRYGAIKWELLVHIIVIGDHTIIWSMLTYVIAPTLLRYYQWQLQEYFSRWSLRNLNYTKFN